MALCPAGALADPGGRSRDALIHDLSKLVEAAESTDWKIDRYEYDELMPDALQSVCETTAATREAALAELDRRVRALGGPVEQAYERSGRELELVADLRFATRVRTVLAEAMRRAPAECPFWIAPSPEFRGAQTDAHRFTLSGEGGGILVVYHPVGQNPALGGGGSGRLLFARGIDLYWSVLAGLEFGGAAIFSQNEAGDFPVVFTGAVPVVLRHHDLTWHYDLELAPLMFFTSDDARPSPGARVGFLLAISGPRFRRIMPWIGIGAAFEGVFPTHVRRTAQMLRGGLRLGFDWDFSGSVPR